MRRQRWWVNLTVVLATVLTLFGDVGASAANEWQLIAATGATRMLRAEPGDVQTFVAPPARPAELRAQAAQITVEYQGFPPEARAAFQYAVDIWQGLLDAPIAIRVEASWGELPEGVLGGAGVAGYLLNQNNNTLYPVALGQQLAGQDPNPGEPDIVARFNSSGVSWYFGTGQAPAGQYNLATVVLHELAHGLGFSDSFGVEGGVGGYGIDGFPVAFDRFVSNSDGVSILDPRYPNPSAALAGQLQGGALFFNGARTRAANGGTPPRLYAPNPFEEGSSIAHFDERTYPAGDPNSLMTPGLRPGETIYSPGAFTLGVFADIGWTIAAAPAPTPSPSAAPSASPSPSPSAAPSASPSAAPSASPSAAPSASPSAAPSAAPSASPSPRPSASPSAAPSPSPTPRPSASPTPVPPPSPAPPSPPPTGSGGNLPGLPNTGDGGMSGEAGIPGWLVIAPFLALGAGLPLARRLRRRVA